MHTLIIAEAGVNHNGDYSIAKKMITAAFEAGADIVKFQTARPELVISKFAQKADYQKETTGNTETQLEMCKKIHLPLSAYKDLMAACSEIGIGFLSTPFDLESIDVLHEIGMRQWKIPSGEITNYPYLVKIANYQEPIILSTGMCTVQEVQEALNVLNVHGARDITLLHCTTEYPAPYEDVNLRAMISMRSRFDLSVGYSDHTQGIEVPIAAVALGATLIEKHFTLDRNMEGPDHKASLEPHEFKEMIKAIRHIEIALGDGVKQPAASEVKNIAVARKSVVAARDIQAGETFTEANIAAKRPGNGISPMLWLDVLGKAAKRDFLADELIEL